MTCFCTLENDEYTVHQNCCMFSECPAETMLLLCHKLTLNKIIIKGHSVTL